MLLGCKKKIGSRSKHSTATTATKKKHENRQQSKKDRRNGRKGT